MVVTVVAVVAAAVFNCRVVMVVMVGGSNQPTPTKKAVRKVICRRECL